MWVSWARERQTLSPAALRTRNKLALTLVTIAIVMTLVLVSEWSAVSKTSGYSTSQMVAWGRQKLTGITRDPVLERSKEHRALGSLYQLVKASEPVWDTRSTFEKVRLVSSRILPGSMPQVIFPAHRGRRQHILVTGGYGSLGRHVVRDLLIFGQAPEASDMPFAYDRNDVVVTILDVEERSSQLDFLLRRLPRFHRGRASLADSSLAASIDSDVVDIRTASFTGQLISIDTFANSGRFRFLKGDVRDKEALRNALSPLDPVHVGQVTLPPVTGVIHLAGYSSSTCFLNPKDCADVVSRGSQNLAELLAEIDAGQRPWIVSVQGPEEAEQALKSSTTDSSARAMRRAPVGHSLRDRPPPGLSHLSSRLFALASSSRLYSVSLRLPPDEFVVGDVFAAPAMPISRFLHNALGHLPIVAYTDTFPLFNAPENLKPWFGASPVSIEDLVEALVSASELLNRASQSKILDGRSVLTEMAIVPPAINLNSRSKYTQDAIELIKDLAKSLSPVSFVAFDTRPPTLTSTWSLDHRLRASQVLGLKHFAPLSMTIPPLISNLLDLQSRHLTSRISAQCKVPESVASLKAAATALDKCFVQLIIIVDGVSHSLACSQDLEEFRQPLDLLRAVPFAEGVRGVRLSVSTGEEGTIDVKLACPTGPGGADETVVWSEAALGGAWTTRTEDPQGVESFKLEVARRASTAFGLTFSKRVEGGEEPVTFSLAVGGKQAYFVDSRSAVSKGTELAEIRFNEICCSSASHSDRDRRFLRNDPLLTSQILYPVSEGQVNLGDSDKVIQTCRDLRAANDYAKLLIHRLWTESRETCPYVPGEGGLWFGQDFPVCTVDCDAPLRSLVAGRCRRSYDRCPRSLRGPFPKAAHTGQVSYMEAQLPFPDPPSLAERVHSLPWSIVIQSEALPIFSRPIKSLVKGHVTVLSPSVDTHLQEKACYDLVPEMETYTSDHLLTEALRLSQVGIDDADFVLVPFYQGCYFNYLGQNTYTKLAETVSEAETQITLSEDLLASNVVIPFSHDWGSCTGWWARNEDVLTRSPPLVMKTALAWQSNGDVSTRCFKAVRDVVIPSRSRNTPELYVSYSSLDHVTSAADRSYLAFFAGGMRGFGAFARTRLGCGRRPGDRDGSILYQAYARNKNYTDTLNTAKFCILPRGIPAWSTRTFEAIYAGCIPAFVADRNEYPFEEIFDYSRFSVTIPENEVDRIDEILASIPEDQVTQLQLATLKVREAFVYSPKTGEPAEEWTRKGPLFYTLLAMELRLGLDWPTTKSC